jgi:hypothetical protein
MCRERWQPPCQPSSQRCEDGFGSRNRFEIHFNPDLQSEIPEKPALNPDAAAEAPVKNRPPANRDG